MLKKFALAGIFALASVVSFNVKSVEAAKPSNSVGPVGTSVSAPVMKGFCGMPGTRC